MCYNKNRTHVLTHHRRVQLLTIHGLVIQFMQRLLGKMKTSGITFKFNKAKAIEVILYLAQHLPVPNIYGICKTLYLADKLSLEKYGRFIFGETYIAMKEGGTPSNAYALLRNVRVEPTKELQVEDNTVLALRESALDYLSKSDIECLNQIIAEYGNSDDWNDRKEACHDKAWQEAWDNKGNSKGVPIPIESIVKTLAGSDDLINYLSNSG